MSIFIRKILVPNIDELKEKGFCSYTWQRFKRELAEVLAQCLARYCESIIKEVYIVELHGGVQASLESLGDKDLDLIIVTNGKFEYKVLEIELERIISDMLEKELGLDPYMLLRVPNIVEIHVISEGDHNYYTAILKSKYAPPVLL